MNTTITGGGGGFTPSSINADYANVNALGSFHTTPIPFNDAIPINSVFNNRDPIVSWDSSSPSINFLKNGLYIATGMIWSASSILAASDTPAITTSYNGDIFDSDDVPMNIALSSKPSLQFTVLIVVGDYTNASWGLGMVVPSTVPDVAWLYDLTLLRFSQ